MPTFYSFFVKKTKEIGGAACQPTGPRSAMGGHSRQIKNLIGQLDSHSLRILYLPITKLSGSRAAET